MPFCPSCRYEYVEGTTVCPDCQLNLVAELPKEVAEREDDVELEPLQNLPGIIYADMVKEVLEKEGIECFIQSDSLTSAIGTKGLGSTGQNAVIFVRKQDRSKAERILHQMLDNI